MLTYIVSGIGHRAPVRAKQGSIWEVHAASQGGTGLHTGYSVVVS